MRVRAIFVLATVSALPFAACGSSFTSSAGTSGGETSMAGASGHDSGAAGLGVAAGGSAVAGGSADSGSAGVSAGGAGPACANPATDCPATGTTCAEAVCKNGGCATSSAAAASECSDHGGAVCDGGGKCVECILASDCPVTTGCKLDVCERTTHACSTLNRVLGVACKEKGGTVCDGSGACVSTHCTDGVQDADETDIDCGGSCAAKCKDSAPQQKCKVPGDCVSGLCAGSPLLCQPPPACAASCTGSCESCAVPGQVGTCAKLPPGVDDPANFCFMQAVCDVNGACVAAQNKGHFGDACTQDTNCFSGSCGAGTCRLRNGDACAEDASCKSGRCAGNVCAACGADPDCSSGKCNMGTCLSPGGYPCAVAADCASQQCFNSKTCAPTGSEACSAQACITHFCKNALCQTCSSSSDCPSGSACTGGSCLAPAGAYCTQNESCASMKCGPAALLSLRKCQ
ncbi:MAG TPA: hypothetical protein VGF76_06970 [Polyangiaceae bacterium]